MTDPTPLDIARAAMQADPDDDHARLRFYMHLADSMVHVLLAAEAQPGGIIDAQVFALEDGRFALAFDALDRLTRFTGQPSYHATMSGRQAVRLFRGQGLGMALNLDDEEAAMLLPAEALDWLAETLETAPLPQAARPQRLSPPAHATDRLLQALDAKLATAGGLAQAAWLCGADYAEGPRHLLLAFVSPAPGAKDALAQAAGEALVFAGEDTVPQMDVLFVTPDNPLMTHLQEVGLRFDLPTPAPPPVPAAPAAPGSDPDKPPRLR
ncbi:MAG: SseB family protein [Qingshengfaniella sp.]